MSGTVRDLTDDRTDPYQRSGDHRHEGDHTYSVRPEPVPCHVPGSSEHAESIICGRDPAQIGDNLRQVTTWTPPLQRRSFTTVTASPPSCLSPARNSPTYGEAARWSRSACFRAPVPWPWRIVASGAPSA